MTIQHSKPWYHILNPFNGTPWKTALILVVMSFLFLSASFVLFEHTNKNLQQQAQLYTPIVSESNFEVQEDSISIASGSYTTQSKVCTNQPTTSFVSIFWIQSNKGVSVGGTIPSEISVPTTRPNTGCASFSVTGPVPSGVTPGTWKLLKQEVAVDTSGNKFQLFNSESKEFSVVP